jgi:hypothetical protein
VQPEKSLKICALTSMRRHVDRWIVVLSGPIEPLEYLESGQDDGTGTGCYGGKDPLITDTRSPSDQPRGHSDKGHLMTIDSPISRINGFPDDRLVPLEILVRHNPPRPKDGLDDPPRDGAIIKRLDPLARDRPQRPGEVFPIHPIPLFERDSPRCISPGEPGVTEDEPGAGGVRTGGSVLGDRIRQIGIDREPVLG